MATESSPQEITRILDDPSRVRTRQGTYMRERLIMGGLVGCAAFSVLITFTIIFVLFSETYQFFGQQVEIRERVVSANSTTDEKEREEIPTKEITFSEFFFGTKWDPLITKHYGVMPLVSATLLVTAIAMAVALPLGLVTAIYLSEYASHRVRATLKPSLEVLAGIPTVVYGVFALTIITPALKYWHPEFMVYNALSAGIAVGILCLPTVCSLTEDALQAVPRSLRDAAYGLGGTRFDVSVKVVVPAALSGIVSAFLLAIARAVGETMIVALAAGATPVLTLDPRDSVQTMTSYMVQIMGGDAPHGTPEYYSLYAVAAILFVITLALTMIGTWVRKRFRETYE